jgi:hypothetical protein
MQDQSRSSPQLLRKLKSINNLKWISLTSDSFAAVQVVFVGGTDQCDLGEYLLVVNATTPENAPFAQKVALKFSA